MEQGHTFVASKLDKKSDRVRDLPLIHRRGPINDVSYRVHHDRRHCKYQILFTNMEIREPNDSTEKRVTK